MNREASAGREMTVAPITGIGEVTAGVDLAAVLADAVELHDGDVIVVTSKVVSKAEGRVVAAHGSDRATHLAAETDRVVARRGTTTIVRTRHGLVMAAAGIDASNTTPGTLVLLPVDPDGSARRLREAFLRLPGAPNVAVVVSDTSGRAWRNGQTDIAVGAAGIEVLDDHAGRTDGYGNVLAVTAPATADELAAAADLATGKLSGTPAAVVRGLAPLVLPPGRHGPGAGALIRGEEGDMFGLGAREAVLAALLRHERRGFGAPADEETLLASLGEALSGAVRQESDPGDGCVVTVTGTARGDGPTAARAAGAAVERAATLAHALGWVLLTEEHGEDGEGPVTRLRFAPAGP